MASVGFEHVTKRYTPDVAAVNDLTLEIQDEEFMVLVGPSGCGKSTALRMLAGLEDVTEGNVRIGGEVVNHIPPSNRDVAMVFQTYALYPHMTVYNNMSFGLKMRGHSRADIRDRVTEAAGLLGLSDFLQRKPRQLSGGQRQRVALGRAIVRHPLAFLLDEPLSNLDAQLRVETRVNLQKLHRDLGATFVYVTHDQVEAMTMGDRIAVMRDGVLQQVAAPRDLYNHPANMYVAAFVGSPRMNFFSARVQEGVATTSGFSVPLARRVDGAEIVVGLRPESIGRLEAGRPEITMRVEVVEAIGSDQFLHGLVGTDQAVARVDPDFVVTPGAEVQLGIDPRRIHIFDPVTEQSLLPA
jgi:multiple sugar transport system ATP-binding protein